MCFHSLLGTVFSVIFFLATMCNCHFSNVPYLSSLSLIHAYCRRCVHIKSLPTAFLGHAAYNILHMHLVVIQLVYFCPVPTLIDTPQNMSLCTLMKYNVLRLLVVGAHVITDFPRDAGSPASGSLADIQR